MPGEVPWEFDCSEELWVKSVDDNYDHPAACFPDIKMTPSYGVSRSALRVVTVESVTPGLGRRRCVAVLCSWELDFSDDLWVRSVDDNHGPAVCFPRNNHSSP